MQVGDLVRVIHQPKNQFVHIVDEVGVVDEVLDGWCNFVALNRNGHVKGGGSVPLECLRLETRQEWLGAKQAYLDWQVKYQAEAEARTQKWHTFLDEVAVKHGISQEKLLAIKKDLDTWE